MLISPVPSQTEQSSFTETLPVPLQLGHVIGCCSFCLQKGLPKTSVLLAFILVHFFIFLKIAAVLLLCQLKTALGLIDNHAGDDQRRGGCWRRSVLHVNDVLAALDKKIVHQPAIRAYSLGAHTAGTRKQVSSLQLRHVALHFFDICLLDIIAVHLCQPRLPVLSGHLPEAAEA